MEDAQISEEIDGEQDDALRSRYVRISNELYNKHFLIPNKIVTQVVISLMSQSSKLNAYLNYKVLM